MKRIIAMLILIGLTSVGFAREVEIGQPAPDFTGTDINAKTIKLSDYKGKIVVLESYNSTCPFSANQFKSGAMQALQKELTAKGVIWLMVDSVGPHNRTYRTPEQARAEWKSEGINATAWLDDNSGDIGRLYGMKTTPHMFVINKEGILAYDGAIDDQPDPFHDPRKARNYVREAVDELQAGKPVTVAETKPYGCAVKYGD